MLDRNEREDMISLDADPVQKHSLRASEETKAAQRGKMTHDWRTPFSNIRTAGGHHNYHHKRITSKHTILIAFFILLLINNNITIITVLAVRRGWKSNQTRPDVNHSAVLGTTCPAGWIRYEGKCYFFSEEERNWTSAQSFCISQGSSLAAIQSDLEKVFMLRFKGEADHWIGLWKDFNDTWTWADGSEHSDTLVVKGSKNCAYLSKEFVIASRCHIPIKWICNQPDAYMMNKNSTADKVI